MVAMSRFEARTDLFIRELHWFEKQSRDCECKAESPVVSLSYLESSIVCELHGDAESIYGAAADIVLGRPFLDFTEKCWRNPSIEASRRAFRQGPVELLKYYVWGDHCVAAHLTIRPTTERGEPGTIAFIRRICPHLEKGLGMRQKLAFPYLVP